MTKTTNRRRCALTLVAAWSVLGLAAGTSLAQGPANPNPGILPIHSSYGSYGEWSARWWQWAYSLPVNHHPLYDTADCDAGQSGKVWFLGASFVSTTNPATGVTEAIATRDCSVPAGKALFVAIANSEASTIEGNGKSDRELSAAAKYFQDFAENLSCEVDGRPVQDLDDYRVRSPMYKFGPLPDNNILQTFGVNAPAGSTSRSVADGVYVMIAPLSKGRHTIHFHADFPYPGSPFLLDITYHIKVE